MKAIVLGLIGLFLFGCQNAPAERAEPAELIGSWIGLYLPKKWKVEATFYADGHVALAFDNNRVSDGLKPGEPPLAYRVRTDSTPWQIDIVQGREGTVFRGILELRGSAHAACRLRAEAGPGRPDAAADQLHGPGRRRPDRTQENELKDRSARGCTRATLTQKKGRAHARPALTPR